MSIIKLFARTIVLFVCSIIHAIGVVSEGIYRLSETTVKLLNKLDNKLTKERIKKDKPKTEEIDVPV